MYTRAPITVLQHIKTPRNYEAGGGQKEMNGIPRGGQGGGSAGPAIPPPVTPGVGSSATEATKKRGPYRPRLKGKEG